MKNTLKENISNPEVLEKLYQDRKQDFCRSFNEIADEYDTDLVRYWKIRLDYESEMKSKGVNKFDLLAVLMIALISGLLLKLPEFFPAMKAEFFYKRDVPIIVFNGIILYAFWQNRIFVSKRIMIYGLIVLVLTLFMNLLPDREGDSIIISWIHSPLFLWCLFGLTYVSFDYNNTAKKIEFIRFNGEFLIMTGLILIAGGILTGITVGLFSVIKMDIEKFYLAYIAVPAAVAAPIVSFYLIRKYPNLTNKIAPVIARVFTPLVLITLTVYLVSLIFSKSKILEDRDLLLMFNVMLFAVLAIIVFSISELDKSKERNINVLILFLLALMAIVINTIALIAILSRVAGGLTPNRTVVLVSNVLIFVNLILIAKKLFTSFFKNDQSDAVEATVARYLIVYAVWTLMATFILPLVYGLK